MFEAITQQLAKARRVVAAVQTFAAVSASVLDPILRSYLREGEEFGPVETVQVALGRWIDTDQEKLEELETRHNDALRELKQLRMRRDNQAKALTAVLTEVRSTFEFSFGRGTADTYLGLKPGFGEVGNDVLRRLAGSTIHILTQPGFKTPEPLIEGAWKEPAVYAERIRSALTPFEASLTETRAQEKIAETTLREKTDLLSKLPDRLKWSTRAVEALLHLSGLGFHAARLRTPVGQGSTADPFQGPVDAGDADGAASDSAASDGSPTDGTGETVPATEEVTASDP